MLKSNRGITITSLIIYVIVLMVVIALLSGFSGYFYKNVNDITIEQNADEAYTRLLGFLTKDFNTDKPIFIRAGISDDNYEYLTLTFRDGAEHQFIHKLSNLYFIDTGHNKIITLCYNVSSCNFSYIENSGQNTVNLNITIDNKSFEKTFYTTV